MSDEDGKRRVEEARKQRAEADLKLRRLEDEERMEEACEEERRKAQAEKARIDEQRRMDEMTQQEWEKRRKFFKISTKVQEKIKILHRKNLI